MCISSIQFKLFRAGKKYEVYATPATILGHPEVVVCTHQDRFLINEFHGLVSPGQQTVSFDTFCTAAY